MLVALVFLGALQVGSRKSETAADTGPDESGEDQQADLASIESREYWTGKIRENAGAIGQWFLISVGGVLEVLGQVIVFLFLTQPVGRNRKPKAEFSTRRVERQRCSADDVYVTE